MACLLSSSFYHHHHHHHHQMKTSLLADMRKAFNSVPKDSSIIIYVIAKKEAENVATFLQRQMHVRSRSSSSGGGGGDVLTGGFE